MITLINTNCNSNFIKYYEALINNLNTNKYHCPNCRHNTLIKWGKYKRKIKLPEAIGTLSIQRVRCGECKKTHSILPSFLVPYSQVLLMDQIDIINTYNFKNKFVDILERNPYLELSNVMRIIKSYLKYWKQRLISADISLNDTISNIVFKVSSIYNRQFMQIRCTINSFQVPPT